jgi:uncharacterized RDD family membrane protein YckC
MRGKSRCLERRKKMNASTDWSDLIAELAVRAVVSAIVVPVVAVVAGPVPAAIAAVLLNRDGSGGAGGACA